MQPFKNFIPAFANLLNAVTVDSISSNAYATQYLQTLLQHKLHYLNIYATVLEKAFAARNNTEVALLDFGTGNGLLALFAKYCGVQKVFASDLSEPFLAAAKQLSKAIYIEIDGWVLGDENALINYFSNQHLDIVVGTDVIEHIYNLDEFFSTLQQINSNIITVFTTASVSENYFKARQLKKLQIQDELVDSNAFQNGMNNEFAGVSFIEVRKKIIANYQSKLSNEIIQLLAEKTRGLNKVYIEKAIDHYLQNNVLPKPINHPTNTCDPITGSWTERLLTIKEYRALYLRHDKILLVHYGFYNSSAKGLKSLFAGVLNVALQCAGNGAIYFTPFIILEGVPRKKLSQ